MKGGRKIYHSISIALLSIATILMMAPTLLPHHHDDHHHVYFCFSPIAHHHHHDDSTEHEHHPLHTDTETSCTLNINYYCSRDYDDDILKVLTHSLSDKDHHHHHDFGGQCVLCFLHTYEYTYSYLERSCGIDRNESLYSQVFVSGDAMRAPPALV